MTYHHASLVLIDGAGILLIGPSGSGKSDLAVRLIDAGGDLVADDQVDVRVPVEGEGEMPVGHVPERLAGRIELRGVGIVPVTYTPFASIHLVVDLMVRDTIPRMPETAYHELETISVPKIYIDPRDASAVAKIRLVVKAMKSASVMNGEKDA